MPRPSLQLLLALVLVLAVGYYWDTSIDHRADDETTARHRQLPQTYLDNPRSSTFDERGALTNIVEADRAELYAYSESTSMQSPRFYAHSGDDKTWSASATNGRFLHQSQELMLEQDVQLSHDQSGGRLTTSRMTIDIKNRVATSRNPVTITHGISVTSADGMVADLYQEQILLSPNVESSYANQ